MDPGHGILTVCPSPPAFAIGLGPTNPWLIAIAKETLGFRRAGLSPALRLLVPTFSLLHAPHGAHARASLRVQDALLPRQCCALARGSTQIGRGSKRIRRRTYLRKSAFVLRGSARQCEALTSSVSVRRLSPVNLRRRNPR